MMQFEEKKGANRSRYHNYQPVVAPCLVTRLMCISVKWWVAMTSLPVPYLSKQAIGNRDRRALSEEAKLLFE